jgi:cbb3-type cytochrome oxidase subunit 3
MSAEAASYFIFGLVLVLLFAGIIAFYYSKKRRKKVEEPKYKMLDDED